MCSMAYESGSRSKKPKPNKVPQRGMGVAQLEKIILEEKHMKDVAILTPNSIPLPPPLPSNHRPLIQKPDAISPSFVSKPMVLNSGIGNSWSGVYDLEADNPNQYQYINRPLVKSGSAVPMPINLGGLSIVPNMSQRSMMEPLSNQNYCSNKIPSLWPEQEKVAGMKRPYPFPMENMPIPTFKCKFPSGYMSPISRFDESTSCSNGGIASLEPPYPIFRDNPLSLSAKKDQSTKKLIDENRGLANDFLTLAPPLSSTCSNSRAKEKLTPLPVEELTLPSYQGQTRDFFDTKWSNEQPLHSFFPTTKAKGNNNGESGEQVDLNLKL